MMDFLDKAVLFLFCFTVYLFDPAFGAGVWPVIITVIFSCLLNYFEREKTRLLLTAGFIAWSVFLPGLAVFLPLVCYELLSGRCRSVCLTALIPLVFLWQSHAGLVGAATAMLLAVSALLRYRAAAQAKLKADYTDMRDTTREMALRLKKQNSDLLEKQDDEINIATLNERNRIAREIHDNVGHLLSSSLLQVGALLAVNRDETVREHLLTMKETLSQAMDSIRASVHDLHDESVDLYAQIDALVRKFTFCGLDFDYDIKNDPGIKLKYAFISIVKEALSNIIRHSDATRARITFREHPALYQLIISDNGHVEGYDTENGIGLKNIAGRVDSFHGNMHISVKNGFEIFISIPKEEIAG